MVLGLKKSIISILIISILGLYACEKYTIIPQKIDPGVQISFQTDIQPLFTSKCISCHKSGKNKLILEEGLAYESLTTGDYISADPINSPETSLLYIQITTVAGHTSFLNDLQKQTILEWIRQGAKDN